MIVPRFPQDRCVILSDGGVESLLACAMAHEQQQLANHQSSIILPSWWEWTQEIDMMISAVDPAIVQQAGTYGLDVFPHDAVYPPDDEIALSQSRLGAIQSRILLEAAQIALRAGIRRVVWPIRIMRPEMNIGMDSVVDEIANTIDRAVLASRLASVDANEASAVEVVIETPFVDLSNGQALDLVRDMSIPLDTCWWYGARSLPNAQDRFEYWSRMSLRSSSQLEHKPRASATPSQFS
ncbi:MAG: hypothetical protein P1U42_08580 [Phycisphaerales bacterium]|nr:hypothetical protein [Phycisphaerales bacterium]